MPTQIDPIDDDLHESTKLGCENSPVKVVIVDGFREHEDDSFSSRSSGDFSDLPPTNLALDEFDHEPLSATYQIRMVRLHPSLIPKYQRHLYREQDYTTFYGGVFTHLPAFVYNSVEELISDLTPCEVNKFRSDIVDLLNRSGTHEGMVARILGETRELRLVPLTCRSLDDDSNKEMIPFLAGEDYRAEHLVELVIEKYEHDESVDGREMYHGALYYKTALEDAQNRISMELCGEPLPPDSVCRGDARGTGFVMPELEVPNKIHSIPGIPCVRNYSYSAISGLSTTLPTLSKADQLNNDKVKRAEKIERYTSTLAFADGLIRDNEDVAPESPNEKLLYKGILIRNGVLRSAASFGIDRHIRSRFKQRVIKGILKARARSFEKIDETMGGCKIIRKSGSGDVVSDRTCLLDAVIAILPAFTNTVEVVSSFKMLMPDEGDTSIAVASGALAAHGFGLECVTKTFSKKGGEAFHILQVRDCSLIINLKLTNLEGLSTLHFISYDGNVLYDQDVNCEVEDSDRRSVKRSKQVFRNLYGTDNGYSQWHIIQVWSLVEHPLPQIPTSEITGDEWMCQKMDGLTL